MANTNRILGNISRDLFILEDEDNPKSSQVNNIWPSTVLDQVYDNLSPTNKTLREIIEELKQEIITGGRGNIVFPVTSINGKTDDVIITKNDLGLGRVDNTADIDKPLSGPQREAVTKMLDNYDFNVNLSDLYDHITNMNNPHDVTIDQINKDDALADFVQQYISKHNYSSHNTVHADIRRSLSQLWIFAEDCNNNIEDRIATVLDTLYDHIEDKNPHQAIFDTKEDVANKVMSFNKTSNNDHTHYPSTRAVVEYVGQKIVEFNDTLPNIDSWIKNIMVIDNQNQLPVATEDRLNQAYFIRNGIASHDEIAICRVNDEGVYYWDLSQLGSYTKFDPKYFIDSPEGLSLNIKKLDNDVSPNGCDCDESWFDLSDDEVERILDISFGDAVSGEIGESGATKHKCNCECNETQNGMSYDDIQQLINQDSSNSNSAGSTDTTVSLPGITSISIVTGTMDGHIRYYINDDMDTMSEDIKVAGLKRLAYLEYVTENELWDQSVHSRHIRDRAIENRHIQDMAVTPEKIRCNNGYIIGNTIDEENPKANEISLLDLANILRPLIGGWPDPTTPGGNPYYQQIAMQIMHPQLWKPNKEYDLGDYSYGARFCGTISCIPNMDIKTVLTPNMTTANGHRIIDAGGAWVYQSSPLCWTILGGSNITGHTFATVTMDNRGLYLESISTGDRIDAVYDIWVKYVKVDEYANAPTLSNGGYVIPNIDTGSIGGETGGSGLNDCDCDERWSELPDELVQGIVDDLFEDIIGLDGLPNGCDCDETWLDLSDDVLERIVDSLFDDIGGETGGSGCVNNYNCECDENWNEISDDDIQQLLDDAFDNIE